MNTKLYFVHVWASSYLKVRYVRCQYTRTSVGQRRSVYLEWKFYSEENRAPDLTVRFCKE